MDEIAASIIKSNEANQASNASVLAQLRGDKSGRHLTNALIVFFMAVVVLAGLRQQTSIDRIGDVATQNSTLISFVSGFQTPAAQDAAKQNTQRGREYIIRCTAAAIANALGHPVPEPTFAPPASGVAPLPDCPQSGDAP